ncbi:hypothetical protein [Psychrobacillus sp. NPDC093180]|uniref:hypothetical protein n=1 Tax=Psychrobacillus sp. NPDC093180 TaxID=3364489 RepID=UPI0037FF00CB
MAIKSTSKWSLLLSILAIACGIICLTYCLANWMPLIEIKESFVQIIQNMRGGVTG